MDADYYIAHISHERKAMNGLSMVVYKITVIHGKELIRTDTWGSGIEMICNFDTS